MDEPWHVFSRLLGGMEPEEFRARYWRRRFLLVPGGARYLLGGLPSRERVAEILGGEQVEEGRGLRLVSFPSSGDPVSRTWWARKPGSSARDPGEPVNIPRADRHFPELAGFRSALEGAFRLPVNLQLFFGPRGAGVHPHRDLPDSVVVQIEGRKTWTVEDPALGYLPRGNEGGEFGDSAVELELGPGDVLYKPSHGLHATRYLEDSVSLTASPRTLTVAEALLATLEQRLAFDQIWRVPLPLGPEATEAVRAGIDAALGDFPDLVPTARELEAYVRGGHTPETS